MADSFAKSPVSGHMANTSIFSIITTEILLLFNMLQVLSLCFTVFLG